MQQPTLVGIRIKNKHEIIPLCLQALAFQTNKQFDIFIYDESDIPITEFYNTRLILDLLQVHNKINVYHQRRIESKNVAQALIKTLKYVKTRDYKYFLMLDADMVLTPKCFGILYNSIKKLSNTIYVEPSTIDITNILKHKDYSVKKHSKEEIRQFNQWGINHQYFKDKLLIQRTTTTASIPLIDICRIKPKIFDDIIESLNKLGKLPGEDIIMYYHLTKPETGFRGMLVTQALAYHYSHTESKRDWYNVTRQIQEKITGGELL